MEEDGDFRVLRQRWVILLDWWHFWATVMVEDGGFGGLGRWWVIFLIDGISGRLSNNDSIIASDICIDILPFI